MKMTTCMSGGDPTILRSPKFTMTYDYPIGTDLEQERNELEKSCAQYIKIWNDSPKK